MCWFPACFLRTDRRAVWSMRSWPVNFVSLSTTGSRREYRTVLARPKFRFDASDLVRVFGILSYQQHLSVTSSAGLVAAESADTKFLEVASATTARVLVTGNLKHYPRASRGKVRVITPAEAIAELQQSGDTPRV